MARRALAFAVCCACAAPTEPPFRSYVSGSDGAFAIQPSQDGELPYALTFSSDGIHLPSSLKVSGMELVVPATDCDTTAGVGIAVVGVVNAVPQALRKTGSDGQQSAPTFVAGDALVQATIPWSIDYHDGNTPPNPEQLSGTTTFTVLPSGRIVRQDQMVVGASGTLIPGSCGCDADNSVNNFDLATFWGFAPGSDVGPTDGAAGDGQLQGCTLYDGFSIGVSLGSGTTTRQLGSDVSSYRRDLAMLGGADDAQPQQPYTSAIQIRARRDMHRHAAAARRRAAHVRQHARRHRQQRHLLEHAVD